MAKITVNKLVSLIIEEINKVQAPDKPMYFKSLNDIINYFNLDENPPESEMGEMANKRLTATFEKLPQPMRIPLTELDADSKLTGPIISKDPDTNQLVEGVIIGDEIQILKSRTRPEGLTCLKFQNYYGSGGLDRELPPKEWIVLPEKFYSKTEPRAKRWGTEWVKPDYSIPVPGENERRKKTREKKPLSNNERSAKYYVIFPAINNFFSRQDILDRLDVSLIPETWAGILRTERTTNKEIRFKFGGNGKSINIQFHAVRDFEEKIQEDGTVKTGLEMALDDIFKNRMFIEMGGGTDIEERKRIISSYKPREWADYIYQRGGNWPAINRIANEQKFIQAGQYTQILKLLKKNIQRGKKGLNVFSKLYIDGDLHGDEYILRAKFTAELNYRTVEGSEGTSLGDLITPIKAEVIKQIPEDIDPEQFTINNNKNFFGKAIITRYKNASGEFTTSKTGNETGMFPELMNALGEKMLNEIHPDEVLTKITGILTPGNVNKEFLNPQEF